MNFNKMLAVLMILAGSLQAEINSLSGTIRNALTLEPLPYANVVIKDTYLGGTSNVDGYFYVSGLEHDSVLVVFSYMGYETRVEQISYKGDTHIILPVALQPQTLGGEEVLVEDSLLLSPEFHLETQVPDELTSMREVDVLEASDVDVVGFEMNLLPRLPYLTQGEAGVQFLIEGVPVFPTRHLYRIYPAFNLNAVKHIAHHAPGKILQADDPYREVTELVYKEGNRTALDLSGSLGLLESGLTMSGPHFAGGSWYISGRRIDFDGIYSLASERADSAFSEFMPDYYFYDLNGKITLDLSEKTKASAAAYLTYDKLHWLGEQGMSAHTNWNTGLVSGRLQHRFSPRMLTSMVLYRARYHSFFRANDIPLGQGIDLNGDLSHNMSAFGIRTVTDYYLGNNNALLFGLGTKRYSSDFDFIDSSSAILDEPWVSTIDLLYRQPLPFSLGVTAGLEGIHNTSLSDFALNPELEVSWSPNNVYSTYLSVSQSTQQLAEVSFSNTLEQPVFDLVLPLDDTVLQPSVLTLRGGGELVPVVGYEIMASFFYEQISDPLLMNHAWTGDITDQSKWLLQFQEAARSGIELSAEKRAGGSQIRLRYRMQTGTLTDQQANEFDLLGERDHRAELIFTGGLGDHGGYKLDLNLASGRHYLDASDDAAVSDFYHRVDVALFREIEINQVQGRLSLKLFNLTGARNDRLNENAWSPLTVEERALALLPFLPTLNLNFNF